MVLHTSYIVKCHVDDEVRGHSWSIHTNSAIMIKQVNFTLSHLVERQLRFVCSFEERCARKPAAFTEKHSSAAVECVCLLTHTHTHLVSTHTLWSCCAVVGLAGRRPTPPRHHCVGPEGGALTFCVVFFWPTVPTALTCLLFFYHQMSCQWDSVGRMSPPSSVGTKRWGPTHRTRTCGTVCCCPTVRRFAPARG